MHRFFLSATPLDAGATIDLAALRNQLTRVLRLQPGARILVLDGDGHECVVELRNVRRERVDGVVVEKRVANGEPCLRLSLYACALKADKFEWILQKGTELGVSAFVPVLSERTIVRPLDALTGKRPRWQAIMREAAEQSGRGCVPLLREPLTLAQALSVATGLRLLPWEEAENGLSLASALRAAPGPLTEVALLIGPEGGLTPNEVALARSAGWQVVTLGPRILRAETAAIAAAAVVMAEAGELG